MDIRSFKNQEIDRLNAEQEKTRRVVMGQYTTEIYWKIPEGMDLDDEETYQYGDKWGRLYITNKKTGEELEIEGETIESDQKRCDHMEYQELDRKQFEFVFGDDAWDDRELLVCPYCERNEKECEEQTEAEKNPITDWCGGWGLSCDDCYYKNHPESDDEVSAEIVCECGVPESEECRPNCPYQARIAEDEDA